MKQFLFFLLTIFTITFTLGQSNEPTSNGYNSATLQEKRVKISPNPARSVIQIYSDSNLKVTNVSIYSIIGSELLSKSFNKQNPVTLNIQSLKKGKYMIRVLYENGSTEVTTLVKE